MTRSPNIRHRLVQSGTKGIDPLVDEMIDHPSDSYKLAVEWSKSDTRRSYLESCLLASSDLDKISALLEVDRTALEMYSKFLYCTEGFDKLDKLELVDADPATSAMKLWAISQGLDFIAWRLGQPISLSPIEGLKDLFSTCVYKSKESLFNANSSKASIESVKWVKMSVDIARLLKLWVMDSNAAKKDLELALQEIIPDFTFISELDGIDMNEINAAQEYTATLVNGNSSNMD